MDRPVTRRGLALGATLLVAFLALAAPGSAGAADPFELRNRIGAPAADTLRTPYGVRQAAADTTAVDPEGHVYVADQGNGRVQEFTAGGDHVRSFGSKGTGPGQLACPFGVEVGAGGDVWVTDACNQKLVRFAASGALEEELPASCVQATTMLPDGRLAYSACSNEVRIVSAEGDLLKAFTASAPNGIAALAQRGGELLVVGFGQSAARHALDGTSLGSIALGGDCTYGAQGAGSELYLVDACRRQVRVLAGDGTVRTFPVDAQCLYAIGVGPEKVFLTDACRSEVLVFERDGTFVERFGRMTGTAAGEITCTSALLAGPGGTVDNFDSCRGRIQRFELDGTHVGDAPWASKADCASQPGGDGTGAFAYLAQCRNGVFDSSAFVLRRFSSAGTELASRTIARGTGPDQLQCFARPGLGADGTVVIVDPCQRRIVRVTAAGAITSVAAPDLACIGAPDLAGGRIYVFDFCNGRFRIIDVLTGVATSGPAGLTCLQDFEVAADGDLIVTQCNQAAVASRISGEAPFAAEVLVSRRADERCCNHLSQLVAIGDDDLVAFSSQHAGVLRLGRPVRDEQPPAVSADAAPAAGAAGWNDEAVTVTLSAQDTGADATGVKRLTYALSGATTAAARTVEGASVEVPVSAEGVTTIRFSAEDAAGNASAAAEHVVRVDTVDPAVSCASPDTAWHAEDRSFACSASDGTSGVDGADGFALVTAVADGEETDAATTGTREVCDVAGNCATAGPIGPVKVDRKAPAIAIAAPVAGQDLVLRSVSLADYACTDGGSGPDACAGPVADGSAVDTARVGPGTFTVSATDAVGNTSTRTVDFRVVYAWTGFFRPVNGKDASGQYVLNTVSAGQAVPAKFSLGGDQGLAVLADGYPRSAPITCSSTATEDAIEDTAANSGSGLTYDATADQYTYVWKTDKAWAGTCRQFVVKLADGTTHRASFKFGK